MGNTEPDFLTTDEVAEMLRVTKPTIYRLLAVAGLPAPLKVGRGNRFVRFEVEQWLRAQPRAQVAGMKRT